MLFGVSGTKFNRVFFVELCPRSIRTTLQGTFFMCNIVWKLSDNIVKGFYFCSVASRVLFSSAFFSGVSRTTLHGVLAVQYCPRSVKAVLLRIFSCVMLFGTSRTTMHKIIFLWKFVEHQR